MHGYNPNFLVDISGFLGAYYLILALMNATMSLYLWQRANKLAESIKWLVVSMLYMIISPAAWSGWPPQLPQVVQDVINAALSGNTGAVVYTVGTTVFLCIAFLGRRFFSKPMVAWTLLNLSLLFMGLSMTSPPFWEIVSKPDNVPIVALVFLLGYFTWLATYRAVQNDDRAKQDLPPLEAMDNEKILVWPDLVYTELICMVALTAVMIVWAILLQAPLEEYASSVKTPNPSKAPWYFLGLQEMLVYYDPWMAGVVLPSLVVFGLMAIPYIDFNKKGNGYYTIEQRPFAYIMFQVGFLELWITLIILGTFLRGPNWNFFGPFETWDPHKVLALNNVNLSDYFWVNVIGASVPKVTSDMSTLDSLLVILKREGVGIIAVLGYFILLPPILASTVFRSFFVKMGFVRYMVMVNLLLFMAALPIKMLLRWTFNLKYIVAIPEYFLNF